MLAHHNRESANCMQLHLEEFPNWLCQLIGYHRRWVGPMVVYKSGVFNIELEFISELTFYIIPLDFVSDKSKFGDVSLPEKFYSNLKQEDISDED